MKFTSIYNQYGVVCFIFDFQVQRRPSVRAAAAHSHKSFTDWVTDTNEKNLSLGSCHTYDAHCRLSNEELILILFFNL